MFLKLMKHEFIATRRVVPYIYLSAVAATLWSIAASYQSREAPLVIGAVLLVCLLMSGVIATFVMIVKRFAQHLYGKEGYLTHTLPTTPGRLLGSKLLSGMLWLLASIAVAGVCFLLLYWFAKRGTDGSGAAVEFDPFFWNGLLDSLGVTRSYAFFGVLLPAFLGVLGGMAEGLIVIYFSITLSQTRWFARWSGASAVLIVLGITMLLQWANSGVTAIMPLKTSLFITQNGWVLSETAPQLQLEPVFNNFMQIQLVSLAFDILASVGLFFGCRALMEKAISLR